ncbi:MAG: hemerythrin domain-containing protein [Myxococcales bacterium]|nr:hemerythrin domain-containing protein [Myxococcales bacterium]
MASGAPEGRRAFFSWATCATYATWAGAGALLLGCKKEAEKKEQGEAKVSATEDLMREHGVIRRVLVVYREVAAGLRERRDPGPPDALHRAAQLIRSFAEDYHEKKLEEAILFPSVSKAGGPEADMVPTLVAQHDRGRQITEYVLAVTQGPIAPADREALARVLDDFAFMYESHAAMEDTLVFPRWKGLLSPSDLDAMGERFEDIEHQTFGKDGFEDAVGQAAAIEKALGLDLAKATAQPPPKR